MTSFEPNDVAFGELPVALKQLSAQSVTVRSRVAAQKLTYLRELVYQAPQVEPIYISGQSQRADGQTKILSGQLLRDAQRHFNLVPHAELRIQVCYHPSFFTQTCVHSRGSGVELFDS